MTPTKRKKKPLTGADPTKGLGAVTLGVHMPTKADLPLPFDENVDDEAR